MKKIISLVALLAILALTACGAPAANNNTEGGTKAPTVTDDAGVTVTPAKDRDEATAVIYLETVSQSDEEIVVNVCVDDKAGDDVGVCHLGMSVSYDSKFLSLKSGISNDKIGGLGVTSQTVSVNPYMVYWVGGTITLPAEKNVIATLTFVPTDAFVGTTDITVAVDPENPPHDLNDKPMSLIFVEAPLTVKAGETVTASPDADVAETTAAVTEATDTAAAK